MENVSIGASYGQHPVQRQLRQSWSYSNGNHQNQQNLQNHPNEQLPQHQAQPQAAQQMGQNGQQNFPIAPNNGANGTHAAIPLGAAPVAASAAGGVLAQDVARLQLEHVRARAQPNINNNQNAPIIPNIANDPNGRHGAHAAHAAHAGHERDVRNQAAGREQNVNAERPNRRINGFDANLASVANVANAGNQGNGGNGGNGGNAGNGRNGMQVRLESEEKENRDRRRNINVRPRAREVHNRALESLDDDARELVMGPGGQAIIRTVMIEHEWHRNETNGNDREQFLELLMLCGGLLIFTAVRAYFEAYRQAAPSWNANTPRARLHQLQLEFSTHAALNQPNQQ